MHPSALCHLEAVAFYCWEKCSTLFFSSCQAHFSTSLHTNLPLLLLVYLFSFFLFKCASQMSLFFVGTGLLLGSPQIRLSYFVLNVDGLVRLNKRCFAFFHRSPGCARCLTKAVCYGYWVFKENKFAALCSFLIQPAEVRIRNVLDNT